MAEIGETVRVNCVGTLDDGRVFLNTALSGEPLNVTIGKGDMPAPVEALLCDLLPGDKRSITLAPERAYGAYDEGLVQAVPSSLLPNSSELPVGGFIQIVTKAGPLRAKVVSVNDSTVMLDCNHEFAGHAATFDVELVSVVHDSAIHRELHPAGCACGCDKLKEQIG